MKRGTVHDPIDLELATDIDEDDPETQQMLRDQQLSTQRSRLMLA